jgi:hypothetical protein
VSELGKAIAALEAAELDLAERLRTTAARHAQEYEIVRTGSLLAQQCDEHAEQLRPFREREGASLEREPPTVVGTDGAPPGLLLLSDLRKLAVATHDVAVLRVMVSQAAKARRDRELLELCTACEAETSGQMQWLMTEIKVSAPQALTV